MLIRGLVHQLEEVKLGFNDRRILVELDLDCNPWASTGMGGKKRNNTPPPYITDIILQIIVLIESRARMFYLYAMTASVGEFKLTWVHS